MLSRREFSLLAAAYAMAPRAAEGNSRQLHDGERLLNAARDGSGELVFSPPEDWISVRSKGAKGDGSTDDLGAIQAAIDEVAEARPTIGGGNVVWFDPGDYVIDGTIIRKHGVHLLGAGMLSTTIRLADGANVPMLKDLHYDAIEAGGDEELIIASMIMGFTFLGSRGTQGGTTSGGLLLAEGGGYYDQLHIIECAGPGWKRVGERNFRSNFPQFDDRAGRWHPSVVTRVGALYVNRCQTIGIHERGTNDALFQHLFVGGCGEEGLKIDGAGFLEVAYAHIWNNNIERTTDYQVHLARGGTNVGHLAVRDGWEQALLADQVCQIGRLTCMNNRRAGTRTLPLVHLKGNRSFVDDFRVENENDNRGTPWRDAFMKIEAPRCRVRCRILGNRASEVGIEVAGDGNTVRGIVKDVTTAIRHATGERLDVDIHADSCTSVLDRAVTNRGGRTTIRYDTDSVTRVVTAEGVAFVTGEHCFVAGAGSRAETPSESVVRTGDIDASRGPGTQTVTVAHGLFAAPAGPECVSITPVAPAGTASSTWAGRVYVDGVDATVVTLTVVTATSGAAGDRIAYAVRTAVTGRA